MFGDPADFDRSVIFRIPGYREMRQKVSDSVSSSGRSPAMWLDAGCGTGSFVEENLRRFPKTQFILSDPSSDMIAAAKKRLNGNYRCAFVTKPTDELNFGDSTLDVITAVLSHHYYRPDEKSKAVENCFRMLKDGGTYIFVEHAPPGPDYSEWRKFQIGNGISEDDADVFFARCGKEFFPMSEEEHIRMLKGCGFSKAEKFWESVSDIGFIAVK